MISQCNSLALEDADDPESPPVIGFCPDWRSYPVNGGKKERGYIPFIYSQFLSLMKKAKFRLYIMKFEDRMEDLVDVLDGIIIPGGRDIDPELYGEQNTSSKFDKTDSRLRWDFCSDKIENAP